MSSTNITSIDRIRTRSEALLGSKPPSLPDGFPRKETIKNLQKCMMAFGKQLFDFYDQGFEGSNGYRLEPSTAYPREYVLDSILAQVSHDVGALQKACQQRMDKTMARRLGTADKLAFMSLQPAVDQGILPVSTVLTYFHKSPNVRVIPYAPVALVGIPFSAQTLNNNYDLLAIPHEVGHHVFRHGCVPETQGERLRTAFEHKIDQEFSADQRWVRQWLEEIFSDIYGCLVATEAMTASFRDILISHSGRQFVGETVKHPIPAVRMYVYIAALHKYGYTTLAQKFTKEWTDVLKERGNPTSFSLGDHNRPISFEAAIEIFDQVIEGFVNLTGLDSLKIDQRISEYSANKYPLWGANGIQSFDEFVRNIETGDTDTRIPELKVEDEKIYADRLGEYDRSNRKLGDTNTWIDIINTNIPKDSKLEAPIPPIAWSTIFDSLNWAEEGPHGRD